MARRDRNRKKKKKPTIDVTQLGNEHKDKLGSLLELSEDQKERIKLRLKKEIDQWVEETSELHRMLEEDNDLVEGIVDESQALWDGAFVTHVPVTGMYMAVFHSVERRSILGADTIWYGELMPGTPDSLRPVLAQIDEMINYKARSEWNIVDVIGDAIWNKNRDGLAPVQVVYARETDSFSDTAIVTSIEEFDSEFPTPEDAGMTDEEFQEIRAQVEVQATMENPIEIPYTAEKIKYEGPKGYVIDLVNFATFPPTVADIEDENCRGYGKRYPLRPGVIRQKGNEEIWYKDAVKRLLKKKGGGTAETPSFLLAQEDIEGFARSNKEHDFWFFELVYKIDLGEDGKKKSKDGKEKTLLLTYCHSEDELVAASDYPYAISHYALFKAERRSNRLIGKSVPRITGEGNYEIDYQHQQRNNSRTISGVPSFKMRKGSNRDFDPEAEENRWRPGVIFKLEDPDGFDQFKVQPVDLGESLAEEANMMKMLDLRTGAAASLLSGHVAPGDPSAPGNKTTALIGQTSLRMEDPIAEDRKGVEKIGDICLSHMYQFGPMFIQYEGDENGVKRTKQLFKKLLKGVRMRMTAITAASNPDAEFARAIQRYSIAIKDPIVASEDEIRYELLRDAFRRGRIVNRDKMLPPIQTVKAKQLQRQKIAMAQIMAEKQQAQIEARKKMEAERVKEMNRSLSLRKKARSIAEEGLGLRRAGRGAPQGTPVAPGGGRAVEPEVV